ncbi:MAG: hypothetical protein EBS60_08285 [Verrucomicrobia bacterium]|nr:hypothetical protein [Verrucomicrobiota bacterium]
MPGLGPMLAIEISVGLVPVLRVVVPHILSASMRPERSSVKNAMRMTGVDTVLVLPGVVRMGCLMVIHPTGGEVRGLAAVWPMSSILVEPLVPNFVALAMKVLMVLENID